MSVTISELWIYPIKSCKGIKLETLQLDALGAFNDRRYMLVDDKGAFITQRQFASLVLIDITVHSQGWLVILPNGISKVLPIDGLTHKKINVEVWGDHFFAFDQGDEWAKFFSVFLNKSVRLVYVNIHTQRVINRQYSQVKRQVSFADGFPLLVTNTASLEFLNQHLKVPISMQRFRPNIVIAGALAFAEMQWRIMSIGDTTLTLVKPCSRCVIPTINPINAKKEKTLWAVLEQFCKADDGAVYFGQNAIHSHSSTLMINQTVDVST
jgi:hypothetical protein